jgi:long-chain acyl-CoA synthetase
VDAEGWYRTGDIGRLDEDGYLTLTGRLKEIIVLNTGKKFSPEPLEQALAADPLVSLAVVFGNNRDFPVALIVPSFEALERLAREVDVPEKNPASLVRHPRILETLQQRLRSRMREFAVHEQVRKFFLLDRALDPERGEVTVTLKPRRAVLEESFKNELAGLYAGA